MIRFAALGDSVTSGYGDPMPGGGRRGWAALLADVLPDPGLMFGLPGVIARPLGRRRAALNDVLDAIAVSHRRIHVDLAGAAYARTNWSVDRLHPSERGHRLLAHSFATALRAAGHPVVRLPGLAATNPEPSLTERVWWMATKGNRWLLRRSTDLVPTLAQPAAREWPAGLSTSPGRPDSPPPAPAART
ncbi:hypothetical protein M1L60_19525 [Actinoplanes sp. TRM 88003]|uniref:SGNH hydrolase-type esterase domain-containing protein n=1 Tax=Paractinoplanes aksuensis TaxID=2939490 RepID=A0ABT1DPL8_9ACTN|nr:hypothetical protein [Actinoplanes aksuensis]MCO8272789.1 hypothetical protein [Actinoplanes aksuensis]